MNCRQEDIDGRADRLTTILNPTDPGQVAPGTQKPIELFFVVNRGAEEPYVHEINVQQLANLFKGMGDRVQDLGDEFAIFTDKTSADNFATRLALAQSAMKHINAMSDAQLAEIVPALEPGKVEDTIEGLHRYTD